jgi:hypothetical protein
MVEFFKHCRGIFAELLFRGQHSINFSRVYKSSFLMSLISWWFMGFFWLGSWTVWKVKFWQFGKGSFDSLKREILTVLKGKFWQFGKGNFDCLEREILTVWKGKFWQFGKGNFDSLEVEWPHFQFSTLNLINQNLKSNHNFL